MPGIYIIKPCKFLSPLFLSLSLSLPFSPTPSFQHSYENTRSTRSNPLRLPCSFCTCRNLYARVRTRGCAAMCCTLPFSLLTSFRPRFTATSRRAIPTLSISLFLSRARVSAVTNGPVDCEENNSGFWNELHLIALITRTRGLYYSPLQPRSVYGYPSPSALGSLFVCLYLARCWTPIPPSPSLTTVFR